MGPTRVLWPHAQRYLYLPTEGGIGGCVLVVIVIADISITDLGSRSPAFLSCLLEVGVVIGVLSCVLVFGFDGGALHRVVGVDDL